MWAPLWRACCRAAGASLGLGGGEAREAGARRGAGRGPFEGAVRSAVPGPAFLPTPLLWVTGGSCGAGVPWSPGSGPPFLFLKSPGRGDSPSLRAPGDSHRVTASPKCMGRLAVQLDRSPPGV